MQPAFGIDEATGENPKTGLRLVTIYCSDLAGIAGSLRDMGSLEAARLGNRLLALQEIVITRDGAGRVLQSGGDSILAVFENASVALNRSLEIQRILLACNASRGGGRGESLRIGLHMGEVFIQEGERLEVISRHVNRARRIMESAVPGQILASDVVVDLAREFISVPREHQAIRHFGEYYLKGVGATGLCEVADLRLRTPTPPAASQSEHAETSLVGRLELAGFRSVTRIGEGAFGVVYRAEREASGQPVAIKVLNSALCESPEARDHLRREAEQTQRLGLPGIVHVSEHHLDQQPPYLVMELVDGLPLDVALRGAAPDRVARVFRGILETLERAHALGMIHCDLKPGNILVRPDDSAVLTDFGLAAMPGQASPPVSSSIGAAGTPGYIAPEVLLGRERGPGSDIYSLGVILFKVLTGHDPFHGESVYQLVQAQLFDDPVPLVALDPGVPEPLQRVCLKALEKNPADRYPGARPMAEDLERFLKGDVVRTRPTSYDNQLFHRVQKHVEQIHEWSTRGLLTPEESDRLLGAYEGLQRRGLPAVMEARALRLWQTLVYVGGWVVINGALLWLMMNNLGRTGKLLLGSVPAVTSFALAVSMWRIERFRLFFVALIVTVLATPLLTGVWLHEFKIAGSVPEARLELELFHRDSGSVQITNRQLFLCALATLVVAAGVMSFTRTATHSAQAALALALFYTTVLLPYHFRPYVEQEQWAHLALKFVPLLLITVVAVWALLQNEQRRHQAPPWVYLSAFLFLGVGYVLALRSLNEWTGLEPVVRQPVSYLLLSVVGLIQAGVGILARAYLRHRCRFATWSVVIAGLVSVQLGLFLAGWERTWPQDWWRIEIFSRQLPFPHFIVPMVAVAITLLACRFQMIAFLMVGLVGLGASIHILGALYFDQVAVWPKVLMSIGAVCFFLALYRELRRTRSDAIDDMVSQSRL